MKYLKIGLACAGLVGLAASVWGHHSAARFDFSRTETVHGTVKLFEVRNPHTTLVLEVADEDGEVREIEFEGHSRNNIYRRGWRPDSLEVGDEVTISIAPLRDGGDGGYVTSVKLPNGTQF